MALTVFAIVAAGSLRVVVAARKNYDLQMRRLDINNQLRVGTRFIVTELRGLDLTDSAGSDIVQIGPRRIEYRAVRVASFQCDATLARGTELTVSRDRSLGYRRMDPNRDSLLIHSGGVWLRRDLVAVRPVSDGCGDEGAFVLSVDRSVPPIPSGTPVMAFEISGLRMYSSGEPWLGMNRRKKSGSWTRIQPVVGPLSADGLLFSGLQSGAIGVRLIMTAAGGVADTAEATVFPRNGR